MLIDCYENKSCIFFRVADKKLAEMSHEIQDRQKAEDARLNQANPTKAWQEPAKPRNRILVVKPEPQADKSDEMSTKPRLTKQEFIDRPTQPKQSGNSDT